MVVGATVAPTTSHGAPNWNVAAAGASNVGDIKRNVEVFCDDDVVVSLDITLWERLY